MGLTPEGIHNSYVMYELMMETFSRTEPFPDLDKWFADYSVRRYGHKVIELEESWQTLGLSVYECCSAFGNSTKPFRYHDRTVLSVLPKVSKHSIGHDRWYRIDDLLDSWSLMLLGATKLNIATVQFDLVDVTREVLTAMLESQYITVMDAYFAKEDFVFDKESAIFLDILDDLDKVLSTNEHFMLGPWLKSAQGNALNEFNARNIITLWGPDGNILDYACRAWSGLVQDYYRPRWALFFQMLSSSSQKFSQAKFRKKFLVKIGWPFTISQKSYPVRPELDTVEVVMEIYQKWRRHSFGFDRLYS
jgi:alpha-N-acetylglucosaminidase